MESNASKLWFLHLKDLVNLFCCKTLSHTLNQLSYSYLIVLFQFHIDGHWHPKKSFKVHLKCKSNYFPLNWAENVHRFFMPNLSKAGIISSDEIYSMLENKKWSSRFENNMLLVILLIKLFNIWSFLKIFRTRLLC